MALVEVKEEDQVIKPQAFAPPVDTSDWPLLLKNYSSRKSTQFAGINIALS
jgi:H/ACA ribonucleoprotein complex subunit 4